MRRKLFLLIACMSLLGTMLAQDWEPVTGLQYRTTFMGQVSINGTIQNSTDIEIAAFVGDQVRAADRLKTFENIPGVYFAWLTIAYNTANESVTFKVYDHEHGTLYTTYDATLNGNPVSIVTGQNTYGTPNEPVLLAFVSTFTKPITGYTGTDDHYYLIASPIGTVSPEDVTNMTSNDFDLYYYDQTQDKEWINYEGSNGNFSLEPGKGYLYANSQNVTLTFAGAPYSGNGVVPLVYDAGDNTNAELIGWNLVGNPFAQPAYIADNRSFYRMNEGGTGLISASGAIAAMEGVFVKAADADDNNITFSTEQPSRSGEQLTVNLSQNRGAAIDRVIIGFSEGDVLPKFMLNENNAKLYIPQGNVDYAVVRSAGVGELPLNFKASKNGTYTLSIDTENMEMNYLHLIDNMTGMDVDLLQTPSYSFEATTRDYESRFKLVFAGASTGSEADESFAFYSNGNWIINNPSTGSGVATLQIVDVNGHLLCNEQINGCCSKSFEAAPGVYMLRLINGENVKTQKIVVR